MLRGLTHYWRLNLVVVLAAAVAGAVLTGALLVGDSVKGSLRDLVLDRLGRIDQVVLADAFFREEVARELSGGAEGAPVILLRGSAIHASTGARAAGVAILGIDERFASLYPTPAPDLSRRQGQIFPSVVLNASLARELDVRTGEAVLLSFAQRDDVPRDSLLGRRETEEVVGTFRGAVVEIIPDEGMGRFGLSPHQTFPRNAYVRIEDLQRRLSQQGRVNAALLPAGGDTASLPDVLDLADLGLRLETTERYVSVESREFVLRPRVADAIEAAAREIGAPALRFQTYLANEIELGERIIPYSMVTAVDAHESGPFGGLHLLDGSPAPALAADEILLNRWTADDLGAAAGDEVTLRYFVVGDREELRVEEAAFRVRGIVALSGLAADRRLTPEYPGIQDADDMSAWDPPFPVDLGLVRRQDEDYWDDHGATPKAFVSADTGQRLWRNRFGTVTAIWVGAVPGTGIEETAERLQVSLHARLQPAWFGYRVLPVREEGLDAAAGATDFSMLFLSFSMFLIVSASLLVGLLFRLGIERRAREVGLLLAVGYPARAVRIRFLAEGLILASAGGLIGVAGGVAYAWLMMAALRTLWLPAVGTSLLFLHVQPLSLALGLVITVGVVGVTIALALRMLRRIPAAALLAGVTREPEKAASAGRVARLLSYLGIGGGLGMLGYGLVADQASNPGLVFGAGSSLLIGGLAMFSVWTRRPAASRPPAPGRGALLRLAVRNSSWARGRSMLSAALVGSACFVIITVAANKRDFQSEATTLDSGSGGYTLLAESDVSLHQDLNRPEGRAELGFASSDEAAFSDVSVIPYRLLAGDDASCLNLYRPVRPRILGVPPEQAARGGFTFGRTLEETDDPWSLLAGEIEPGVIPALADANSAQWVLHKGLGDDVILEDEYGAPLRLRLVGLFQKSLFQGNVLISEAAFLKHFPSHGGFGYFLIDVPEAKAADMSQLLEATLGPFGFDVTFTRTRLADFQAVENTYMSTFQLLGGLGLLLGTVGLGIILVRNVLERHGELATLRAFGYRRASLGWMVLAENVFLLTLGMGLGSGSALIAQAPHLIESPGGLPWLALGTTLAAVFLTGLLSCIAAVRHALRTPLLPALKAER